MSIGRLALVMLLSASPASAHALLERAIPSAGGEVAMSPPEIVLTFTERVEPLFSTTPNRANQATRSKRSASPTSYRPQPATERGLLTLLPGTYTVIWYDFG